MKKGALLFLLIFFSVIIAFFVFSWQLLGVDAITGRAVGSFNITVGITSLKVITIQSPTNTTYNFSYASSGFYPVDLNVSANFDVSSWRFTLIDLTHDTTLNSSVSFTPNITLAAVRWWNNLTVFANATDGLDYNVSVSFFINVQNHSPFFGKIDPVLFVCEGSLLAHKINASDLDEDNLIFGIDVADPFFVFETPTSQWVANRITYAISELYSSVLDKSDVGNYRRGVSVTDGSLVATNYTNITVIEINNAPTMSNIGVHTVQTRGDNSTFYYATQVSDTEDGNQASGNLSFNVTFFSGSRLFNISLAGVMNYTSNGSDVGVYNVSVCATDLGIPLARRHQNISLCGQDGSNRSVCNNFELTITNENRRPVITSNYPTSYNLSAVGASTILQFNISDRDPDGTTPDTYWYVDDSLKEYDANSLTDYFSYTFGCGVSGQHQVEVFSTDGLLNASVQWNVSVSLVSCPGAAAAVAGAGGGGGGAGAMRCAPKWACRDWGTCQKIDSSEQTLVLGNEDKRQVGESCFGNNWGEENCGIQFRNCFDINSCNLTLNKPLILQACYYTPNPSCFDGIKNCHDGSCEFLVDCGGPCKLCPTCSDKIQNQGEAGIDCGGPCPGECPILFPAEKKLTRIILIIICIIIFAFVAYQIYRILKKFKKNL